MPLFAGLDTGEHICADSWVVYVRPNWDSTDPFYDVECKRVSHRIYQTSSTGFVYWLIRGLTDV